MDTNFRLIGGFGIPEKEIKQKKKKIYQIIDKYYQLGIREFFIGYNPSYWHENFGFEFSPNMRFGENEQITSYETFTQAVEYVHSLKKDDGSPCEINLTVNSRYYTDFTMPYIQKIISEAINAGIDGVIVSGPEILEYLSQIGFKGNVNISTILCIYNEDSIDFLIEYCKTLKLKLNRLILPREITLKEIHNITSKFPQINFEVFGQGDFCRYANGFCMAEHKYFARDICGFVLKHGLSIKKTIRSDFKQIITNKNLSNKEKQEKLDNELNDIKDIFTVQTAINNNNSNKLLLYYIDQFENNFFGTKNEKEQKEIAEEIQKQAELKIKQDFPKFIYDGLLPDTDIHNQFIQKFITINKLTQKHNKNYTLEKDIQKVQKLMENIKKTADKNLNQGKFSIQTYYKFMILNRTSAPFLNIFNSITNIKVVKIPLRGRDAVANQLGIQETENAVKNPSEYINDLNISGRYFHYDPNYLQIYKDKLNQLLK